ncbi:MAG: SPOR domain-containing protein [Spirochaetia bacterium]|jgi:hypothetical protein|nr:SPOR domain-containing protein [Spirochaetia bacterium]
MKRIIFLTILGMACALSVSAQKVWEGTVVAGRYGDFPPTGYYGASNVFPRNSLVNVQNISNGKIVQLIISGGLDDPAMFLAVSRQVADALDLQRNDSANVRVSLAAGGSEAFMPASADLPYSNDPEVNPAAWAGDVNALVEKDAPFREKKEKGRAAPAPDPVLEAPPVGTLPVAAPPVLPPPAPEEPPSISDRVPANGSGKFEIKESPFAELPEEKPSISERISAEKGPRIAEGWVLRDVEAAPAPMHGIAAPGDLPTPEAEPDPDPDPAIAEPETAPAIVEPETPAAPAAETETIVTLEPAQARPPVEPETPSALDSIIAAIPEIPAPADDGKWAEENLPLVTSLPEKSYYLQIASHKNPESIKPVVDTLTAIYPVYPVVVLAETGENPFYRVMVGPLKEDERGLMLRQIKAQGYHDAFLKEIR